MSCNPSPFTSAIAQPWRSSFGNVFASISENPPVPLLMYTRADATNVRLSRMSGSPSPLRSPTVAPIDCVTWLIPAAAAASVAGPWVTDPSAGVTVTIAASAQSTRNAHLLIATVCQTSRDPEFGRCDTPDQHSRGGSGQAAHACGPHLQRQLDAGLGQVEVEAVACRQHGQSVVEALAGDAQPLGGGRLRPAGRDQRLDHGQARLVAPRPHAAAGQPLPRHGIESPQVRPEPDLRTGRRGHQ